MKIFNTLSFLIFFAFLNAQMYSSSAYYFIDGLSKEKAIILINDYVKHHQPEYLVKKTESNKNVEGVDVLYFKYYTELGYLADIKAILKEQDKKNLLINKEKLVSIAFHLDNEKLNITHIVKSDYPFDTTVIDAAIAEHKVKLVDFFTSNIEEKQYGTTEIVRLKKSINETNYYLKKSAKSDMVSLIVGLTGGIVGGILIATPSFSNYSNFENSNPPIIAGASIIGATSITSIAFRFKAIKEKRLAGQHKLYFD